MGKKIIILDFETEKVHVFPFDEHVYDDDGEDFIAQDPYEIGISEVNCQWMIVDDLIIQIH